MYNQKPKESIITMNYEGFGFITFDSEESANQVLQEHYIQFNGKQVEFYFVSNSCAHLIE